MAAFSALLARWTSRKAWTRNEAARLSASSSLWVSSKVKRKSPMAEPC